MRFPTPEDMGDAPVWTCYVVAQTAQACLGLIPRQALAVGVSVDGREVRLRFQLCALTAEDAQDIEDIIDSLRDLVGDQIKVTHSQEVRQSRLVTPFDGVFWIFLARFDEGAPRPDELGDHSVP